VKAERPRASGAPVPQVSIERGTPGGREGRPGDRVLSSGTPGQLALLEDEGVSVSTLAGMYARFAARRPRASALADLERRWSRRPAGARSCE
jgi:hypothetical protein